MILNWNNTMKITRLHKTERMSKVVVHNNTIYLCGQVGSGNNITEQTTTMLEKVDALLAEGFSIEVIEALKSVTKESLDEDYDLFIQRAMQNPIGRKVKIADLRDNLDVTRISDITEKDVKRINKYKKALKSLSA
mgnify:CR=1 FL=1